MIKNHVDSLKSMKKEKKMLCGIVYVPVYVQ